MTKFAGSVLAAYLLVGATGAHAQQNLAPAVFGDKHQSEYGNFSHWSAVYQKDPTRIEIEYAVCNFDGARPLIYKWNGPNIGVGEGGTLPVGKCHVLRRDVAAIEHDRNASISFTQAARKHPAPAHLSKIEVLPPGVVRVLPRFVTNSLRTFYSPEGDKVQPSLANLVVTQVRNENGDVQHTISWYPPTVSLAIGMAAFGGVQPDAVAAEIKGAGYDAVVSNLKAVLPDSAVGAIPAERLAQPVVLLTKMEKSAPLLQFKLGAKAQVVSGANVILIDTTAKKLVTDVEISAFVQ
jgi:hypothetical protein